MHQMLDIDHWLECLRSAAICAVDMSDRAVLKEDSLLPHPIPNSHHAPLQCVDGKDLVASHSH